MRRTLILLSLTLVLSACGVKREPVIEDMSGQEFDSFKDTYAGDSMKNVLQFFSLKPIWCPDLSGQTQGGYATAVHVLPWNAEYVPSSETRGYILMIIQLDEKGDVLQVTCGDR